MKEWIILILNKTARMGRFFYSHIVKISIDKIFSLHTLRFCLLLLIRLMDHNIFRMIVFGLATFFVAMLIIPSYIRLLRRLKLAKQIRTEASLGGGKATKYHALHIHKQGTPNL